MITCPTLNKLDHLYDIRDFGAVLDGATDDSDAWDRAIDSAGLLTRVFCIPHGVSRLTRPIDLRRSSIVGVGIPSNAGGATTVKFESGGFYSSINENTGFSIENMLIQGVGAAGQILVDYTGQNNPRMRNVRLDLADICLKLDSTDFVECHYGQFERVDLFRSNIGCDIGISSGNKSNGHNFHGGRVWNMNPSGIGYRIAQDTNNINMFGVFLEVGGGNTAVKSAGRNISFFGCRWETTGNGTNLVVDAGAGRHSLFGSHWSSGFDIVDANTPSVVFSYDEPFPYSTNRIGPHETFVILDSAGAQHELTIDATGRLLIDGAVVGAQT